MQTEQHGLFIGIERINNLIYLSLAIKGMLTHDDYNTMTPLIDSAIKEVNQPKVNCLVDITQLKGWELRAAWDDFKLGLNHGSAFNKIAIVGHTNWQQWAAKIGSWFISGEIKAFESNAQALDWLQQL